MIALTNKNTDKTATGKYRRSCMKGTTHYISDQAEFDVSTLSPSLGINIEN